MLAKRRSTQRPSCLMPKYLRHTDTHTHHDFSCLARLNLIKSTSDKQVIERCLEVMTCPLTFVHLVTADSCHKVFSVYPFSQSWAKSRRKAKIAGTFRTWTSSCRWCGRLANKPLVFHCLSFDITSISHMANWQNCHFAAPCWIILIGSSVACITEAKHR